MISIIYVLGTTVQTGSNVSSVVVVMMVVVVVVVVAVIV